MRKCAVGGVCCDAGMDLTGIPRQVTTAAGGAPKVSSKSGDDLVGRYHEHIDSEATAGRPGHPSALVEAVADALIRYETSGCCRFGQTCGLCDCAREGATPEQLETRDAMDLDRARAVLALIPPRRCAPSEKELAQVIEPDAWALSDPEWHDEYGRTTSVGRSLEERKYVRSASVASARKIAELYGDQPTVTQVKAEAWSEGYAAGRSDEYARRWRRRTGLVDGEDVPDSVTCKTCRKRWGADQ